ncbi:hypothetical protein F5890DRAFT_1484961 [Lentinula detonsa]|uniref:Uncharacterized protein n=1 Tax=Lentinula detonsa TaxID=2804962 RepID=A0AA38Q944_9AGAR|nr:hypothetical protein F5890DRAFT_1484961 [Lentinula detonsa]
MLQHHLNIGGTVSIAILASTQARYCCVPLSSPLRLVNLNRILPRNILPSSFFYNLFSPSIRSSLDGLLSCLGMYERHGIIPETFKYSDYKSVFNTRSRETLCSPAQFALQLLPVQMNCFLWF